MSFSTRHPVTPVAILALLASAPLPAGSADGEGGSTAATPADPSSLKGIGPRSAATGPEWPEPDLSDETLRVLMALPGIGPPGAAGGVRKEEIP